MTRLKAASIHLGISAAVAAAVVAAMLLVWYPDPFFAAMGGNELVLIIVGVDVVLGPLVTLVIFNPHKAPRLLRLDLSVIGFIQAAALAYGVWVVAEVRPAYMVFTVDRFDLVSVRDIKDEELARVTDPRFKSLPWGRPPTIAVANPKTAAEQMRVIQSALQTGADLQTFPQYYVPYETLAAKALAKAKPVARLRKSDPEHAAEIDSVLASLGRKEADVLYLPLKARARDFSVILDAKTGAVLGFAKVIPW